MFTAFLLASALLAGGEDGLKFDLICSGTMSTTLVGGRHSIPERRSPWLETYRIDLANNLWCKDSCKSVLPIVEANAGSFVLMEAPDQTLSITINRITGLATDTLRHDVDLAMGGGTIVIRSEGACERSDFTPFPPNKF